MGLNLRKLKDAAFAQINPFDGGKTASTVWNNTPVGYKDQAQTIRPTGLASRNGTIYIDQQARQASQARPQQSFIPDNQKKPSGFMGALNAAIDSPLSPVSVGKEVFLGNGPLGYLGKATSTGPLAKPTQGIRDTLFDANTAKDIAKRNQAELAKAQMAKANGQVYTPKLNQTYMEQQASLGRRGRNNFGDQMVGGFAENLNTVGAKLYETPETLRGTVAASTGNQEALRMSLERQKKNAQMLYGKNSGGLLNTGTIYDSPEQTMNLSAGDTAKRVFGGQLEAASMVVGGGALPSIAKSGLKGLASYGGKTFASGAMGLGGNEMSTNPNASAMDIVKQSALGGVFGLGLGVAGDAAVKGVGMGVKAIKPKVELTKVNQQGSIDPAQAFKNIRDKLNGSALDTTVKPATPENVYGVNALEKLGKKLKMNQGGGAKAGDIIPDKFLKDDTPPINKQTNTANSTPAKTTVEVDSLYDGGKSSKDGSDLYGTPDGYKYTVEIPSQQNIETYRAKKAERNAKGYGYVSSKSDIVVKLDGEEVNRITYDKAVEKYGTTDPEKLANLAANQGVEPATPKPVVKAAPPTEPNVVKSSTPELSFTERQALAQANKESQILKPRGVESIRAKGRDVSSKLYNPYSEAERLNHRNAKAQNLSVIGSTKKLDATQDLASKMDFVANSRVAAKQLMEDTGLDKVVQKYPDKKGKVNEFVLYLAAKRDVAVSGAKGKRIYGGETLDDVNKFVADFEARNPQAKSDLEAVKGSFRKLLDDELKSGNITPEFHRNAIATEDYYAPIERVLGSEDVLRPSVNVNNKASLSRSSATKKLEGSADPIKGDWDAIIGGMQRRVRETKLNQAYGVMYDIAKNKRVDDAVKLGMSKEQSQAFIGLQDTIASLQKQAQTANKTVKTASKKARVESKKMTAYTNKVNDKAIERIAKNLEVNDVDGAATIRGLKRSDKNQLMDWLQGNMTDAEITNGIKKSSQLQDAMARLQEARAIADDLKTEGVLFKGAKSELVKATDARGRQVIRGFVDGYPTWLEVTPEIAKMVQGLEPQKLPGLIKGLSSIQRVWRTFWTGAYNPVFAAKSFLLYDPPMGAINQSGSRFQLDPRVLGKAIADIFTDYDGFFKELKRTGVQPVYGSKMSGDIKLDAKVIASHKNFQKRIGYLATHPGQLLEALDVIGGKLAHSTRMRTARAELARSLSKGLSKKVATENAARAYNNILPNYGRTTRLMKEIDAIIPYASAGVAGNRALTTAMRTDPAGWATKVGLFATAIAATGEYALTSDETKAFYQDMYDSKKVSVLQNNIVFALPGAKKDPKTGEWSGIVKIALPPEFRAPNAVLQQSLADNNGIDTGEYKPGLAAVTSLATAGITNIGRTGGVNAEYNPAIQAVLELSTNRQGGAGDSFTYGDNKFLPRNEQINKDTSQLAVSAAQAYNKLPFGDVSPTALDAQFKGLGMGGNVIRSVGSKLTADASTPADRLPGTGLGKTVKGLYSADGTKGMTDTSWHFKNQEAVKNELPTEGLRNQFDALNSKNDSPGDAGAKAGLLYESVQTDGALWNAQKKQNDLDAARTGISNPLFDLSPEQARAVTLYRSNARMNAAKQTYAKDGSSLFQSLGLDEKWYQDFKTQESAFYDKIKDKTKGDSQAESVATGAKTYSGNPYKEPSMVIQSKLDKYYTLPKGTGARTAFLKDNPDVIQYWDEQNGLANEERIAMGLDLLDSDSNDSGYGSKGYSKYGYSRGGGSGGGGSGDGLASEYDNPYKYAVSIKAKGSSKATVKLGGKIAKRGVTAKATSKPKVTIKKSTA